MAADKRENSVLFSLRELRQIEDDRVKQEENSARQKVEDERRAREDEIRRQREEEDRKRREILETERLRAEEEQRRLREEELRLMETERKHQIDAQARLEEQRLRMEIEAKGKMASNKRIKVLMGVAGAMAVVVGLLIFFVVRSKQESEAKERVAKAAIAQRDAELADFKKQLDTELAAAAQIKEDSDKLLAQYETAHNEDDRKRLRAEYEAKRAEYQRSVEKQKAIREAADRKARAPVNIKCANPNDPLCGAN
jgi:hypothetical protein